MEAPSIDGANTGDGTTKTLSIIAPQWRRRRSTARTRSVRSSSGSGRRSRNGGAVDRRRELDIWAAHHHHQLPPPQWRRRRSTARTGAPQTSAGKRRLAAMEAPSIDGANCARRPGRDPGVRAAMEAPSIDGANEIDESAVAHPSIRRNGGAVDRRREPGGSVRRERGAEGVPQWRRRRSTARTGPPRGRVRRFVGAAMEAPSIDGANGVRSIMCPRNVTRPQWRRRRSTARTRRSVTSRPGLSGRRNGGAVDRRREPDSDIEQALDLLAAAMEAPSIDGANCLVDTAAAAGASQPQWRRRRSTARTT